MPKAETRITPTPPSYQTVPGYVWVGMRFACRFWVQYEGDNMARTTKTVWYKRARIGTGQRRETLQALLKEALAETSDPNVRLHAPFETAGPRVGINRYSTQHGMLVGQFISFQPGNRQPIITIKSGVQAFDLDSIAPTSSAAERREFLEGIGHFAVFGNHVLLVQSRALGSKEFESYLNWLLSTATETIEDTAIIVIADQISSKTQRKVAHKRLRGVTIGTPLKPVAVPETDHGQNVLRYEASGTGFEALRGLLGPDVFKHVKLTDALDNDNVFVQITIRVKGKRTVSDETHAMLDALATSARHFDPEDISMEVQGIGTLKGDEIKIHHSISVETLQEGGLINEDELWQKMNAWLQELIEHKQVPA